MYEGHQKRKLRKFSQKVIKYLKMTKEYFTSLQINVFIFRGESISGLNEKTIL